MPISTRPSSVLILLSRSIKVTGLQNILFGGHVDKYDYHVVGLNEEFLTEYLKRAGFINIIKVEEFGLFNDTSNMKFKEVAISLNITAEKPSRFISDVNIDSTLNKVGRNELCPCGSGKKFKKCHGKII